MGKVTWAPSALEDVNSIAELLRIAYRNSLSPGRVIPEIGKQSCREIIYGSYRIMYRLDNNEVWITGVIHGARNL